MQRGGEQQRGSLIIYGWERGERGDGLKDFSDVTIKIT